MPYVMVKIGEQVTAEHVKTFGFERRPNDQEGYRVEYVSTEIERALWIEREMQRFRSGEYLPVPWATQIGHATRYQFAHLSKTAPGQIAFTKDDEKGHADRQTTMRPAKYLSQYYSHFSASEIKRYVDECNAYLTTVIITRDADEIEAVYLACNEIPNLASCMTHETSWYSGNPGIHPTRVYGAGDLALAYTKTGDEITARAIVWPDRSVYYRLYGNQTLLETLLQAQGYTHGSLVGARIDCIRTRGGVVVPYFDGCGNASTVIDDDGHEYLKVGSGKWRLSTQAGLQACWVCAHCNNGADDVHGDICQSCYEENYFTCDSCSDVTHNDDSNELGGEYYCNSCYRDRTVQCDHCGERMASDSDDARSSESGDWYCDSCYSDRFMSCEDCSCEVENDDTIELDGEYYCESCADDRKTTCAHPECSEQWHESELDQDLQDARERDTLQHLCTTCADRFYAGTCDTCGEYILRGDTCCYDAHVQTHRAYVARLQQLTEVFCSADFLWYSLRLQTMAATIETDLQAVSL